MNIYIAHPRGFDFRSELYEPLLRALGTEHNLILPHAESEKPFPSRQLFESGGCDLVLAEVSSPSTGLGIELGWASSKEIPIHALWREGAAVSGSISAVCSSVTAYKSPSDLEAVVRGLLKCPGSKR